MHYYWRASFEISFQARCVWDNNAAATLASPPPACLPARLDKVASFLSGIELLD